MKKTTLKISLFLSFVLFAFQGYAQFVSTIVEGTKYNIINVGTGNYLQANGTGQYIFSATAPDGSDNTFNFTFYHHDTIDPGADPVDTSDDTVHNYPNDWNIQGDVRGIMRASSTGTVHTNFKYNIWNSNGGHKTDKRWEDTEVDLGGTPGFRFSPLADSSNPDRFLYEGTDGVLYNYSEATMDDAGEATTDGQLRSYWVLVDAAVLSNEEFDASSIFVSNPVNDVLSIKGLTPNVKQISVYSLIGKEVMAKKVNGASSLNLNVSPLASGMYIVDFKGENGNFTKKIVKQ